MDSRTSTQDRISTPDKAPIGSNGDDSGPAAKDEEKKTFASKLKGIWTGLDMDVPTLLTMMKGGIPPALSMAMYEADAVASIYSTLGYLVAIISILSFCIMPRAKFIQTMMLNLFAICLGAAVGLIVVYCSVQARIHTTVISAAGSAEAGTVPYNSSASVVSAIWLFVQVFFVNTLKAKYPQFQFPSIMYSIFVIVTCTYSPQFPTMNYGISFMRRLLETFLTGFAVAAAVHFVVFPVTCRKVVLKEFAGYLGALQGGLKAHQTYLHSLEDPDNFAKAFVSDVDSTTKPTAEAAGVRAAIGSITALHGKLQGDLPFAKREIALGKLGPDDLKNINKLIRAIMLPIVGLGAIMDVFDRIAAAQGWSEAHLKEGLDYVEAERRKLILNEWSDNIIALRGAFDDIIEVMNEGLEHVALQLQLKKAPKAKKGSTSSNEKVEDDIEARAESTNPGGKGFADYLDQKTIAFNAGKESTLRAWCERHGIELSTHFFDHPADAPYSETVAKQHEDKAQHLRNQRQLYLLLYIEFLLHSSSRAILDMVRYADGKVESGKLAKTRLILPGLKRTRKWLMSITATDDGSREDGNGIGDVDQSAQHVDMGQSFRPRKDPEHLPPTNFVERMGDTIRGFPGFFRSSEAAFGFRVAVATMSIAIIGFLHDTQTFFVQNRLLWAMIMVAISMTPTAGQSLFSFMLRILGTVVAMIAAFLVWYIPDSKTPGVLVFLWFFSSIGIYVPLKKPQFAIIGIISIVTTTLIVGYELEVRKIGQAAATSNGQTFYPIYILGPYRLATVAAGLLVAFIWTIFPYPISEHSILRQSLGGALYLLANYYSIIHETVQSRVRNDEGDPDDKQSPGHRLSKMRLKVFAKQMQILTSLKTYSSFVRWEIPIGGKFPKQQYDALITSTEHIINYISLVGYASAKFSDGTVEEESVWASDFRKMLTSVRATSHEITGLLSLLSASIANGQPLPPYLKTPQPYQLSAKLEEIDHDILSVRHIAEPGYAAFAVIQISSRCIIAELDVLLRNVKEIFGELDFSFHIVSTASSLSDTLNASDKDKHD
ncbi:MFS transporter [Venturia nashicola]|uniref:MFS transporter n=1 Tax=Venturia nashicola TaxID=86259 RepID=A0A4Z1PBW1_9PEZI|nr:MFS transporter [Venturia nashicola]TLD29757.1 MFS transporter [Venturia nashicola]